MVFPHGALWHWTFDSREELHLCLFVHKILMEVLHILSADFGDLQQMAFGRSGHPLH